MYRKVVLISIQWRCGSEFHMLLCSRVVVCCLLLLNVHICCYFSGSIISGFRQSCGALPTSTSIPNLDILIRPPDPFFNFYVVSYGWHGVFCSYQMLSYQFLFLDPMSLKEGLCQTFQIIQNMIYTIFQATQLMWGRESVKLTEMQMCLNTCRIVE